MTTAAETTQRHFPDADWQFRPPEALGFDGSRLEAEGAIPSADAPVADIYPEMMYVAEGEGPKPGRHAFAKKGIFGHSSRVVASARETARAGWLWLNLGRWRDRQVVPEA